MNSSIKQLAIEALIKFTIGFAVIAGVLLLSAGTWAYRNAWVFLGILFGPMLLMGAFLLIFDPQLLSKRLKDKETESTQKRVVIFSAMLFLGGFIAAGLDYRFAWLQLPDSIVFGAVFVFLLGYAMYAEVMRENAYLSRTIEVQKNQKVIDTGLYGIVRHPMYTATILMFLAMPLVLGSLISFLVFLGYPFLLIKRIKNEEEVLSGELTGYKEYKKRVRYRLLPWIW